MTALDERPAAACHSPARCPQMPDVAAELRDALRRERLVYELGRHDGYAAGVAAAERELAEHWSRLAASIRRDANRLKRPVPEPVARSNDSDDDSIWFTAHEWASWAGQR